MLSSAGAEADRGDIDSATETCKEALKFATTIGSPRSDEIRSKMKFMRHQETVAKKLKELMAAVEKDPENVKAKKELIVFYIQEKDDPSTAELLIGDGIDKELAENLSKAARAIDKTKPADRLVDHPGAAQSTFEAVTGDMRSAEIAQAQQFRVQPGFALPGIEHRAEPA